MALAWRGSKRSFNEGRRTKPRLTAGGLPLRMIMQSINQALLGRQSDLPSATTPSATAATALEATSSATAMLLVAPAALLVAAAAALVAATALLLIAALLVAACKITCQDVTRCSESLHATVNT